MSRTISRCERSTIIPLLCTMSKLTLIRNISQLVQVETEPRSCVKGKDMNSLPIIGNAYLLIENELIAGFGKMSEFQNHFPHLNPDTIKTLDVEGRMVFPSFCDSHTHLVYAGSREKEFEDRIAGLSYEEIAKRGGGILNSAKRLGTASETELYESAMLRIHEIISYGTGAVEIKSGYGLSVEAELKMLRVIRKIKETAPLAVKATFLGAHAFPAEFKENHGEYIRLLTDKMIPMIAGEGLADYIDVFCDRGFFSPEETNTILEAGAKYGLTPKIHANELGFTGGVQSGVANHALSVDHLEHIDEEEIALLKGSSTMPTLLPSTAFFLGLKYPPARKMIDAGLPVALASDYNPGSSPSGKMPFVLSLACIKMKMTPAEAIHAATVNGAYAMGLEKTMGSITIGKVANIFITRKIPGTAFIPYSFGSDLIEEVFLKGKKNSDD